MAFSYSLGVQATPIRFLQVKQEAQTSQLYAKTMQLLSNKQFYRALQDLKRLVGSEKSNQAEVYWLLGRVMMAQNRFQEAIAFLDTAISHEASFFNAHTSLGEAYCQIGDLLTGVGHFHSAMQLKPEDPEIPRVIAEALVEAGQIEAASKYYLKSLELAPKHWGSWVGVANCLHSQGRVNDAIECSQKYLAVLTNPHGLITRLEADAHSSYLFMKMASEKNFTRLMEAFGIWSDLYASDVFDLPEMLPAVGADGQKRRIRVGFLGSDFYAHAATLIYRPLFERVNREQFETFVYSSGNVQDHITDKFKQNVDHWLDAVTLSDEQLFQRIRSDGLDILVDLNGHTSKNRLMVFARKAAPIQLTGLGFISPLNIPHFEGYFTDRHITTPDREGVTAEQPIFLPSIMHWQPDIEITLPEKMPYEVNGYITFGCGNNLYKLNEQVLGVWAQILKQVRHSRLLIKAKQLDCEFTEARVRKTFEGFGIEPERLILLGTTGFGSHILTMGQVDITLDPFPYQGGITTCESLYMGAPVVTLDEGTRTSVSILRNVGPLAGRVAEDIRDYIAQAVSLAQVHRSGQGASREAVREALFQSAVTDSEGYATLIYATFNQLVNLYQAAMADL